MRVLNFRDMSKGGRPRGPNYVENLKKRLRSAEAVERVIQKSSNTTAVMGAPNFRTSPLHAMAKAFFNQVNSERIAGRAAKPVYTYEETNFITDGIRLRNPLRPAYQDLRNAAYGTSIIGAIHKLRVDDLGEFADPRKHFSFEMLQEEDKPSPKDLAMIHYGETFFVNMGLKVEGYSKRDRLKTVMQMMIRDTLTIDSVCFYLVKNRLGKLIEIRYLDPATIFPVDPDRGFRNDTSVGWVQIIDNQVVETFKPDQIIVRHQNELSDVHYKGTGLSPTETSIMELVGVINALKYNRQRFSNNPPPGFLSVLGSVTEETLDSLSAQWQNVFSNNENNFQVPLIGAEQEVKWTPLQIQSEMAFDKLMQWLCSLVFTAHGVDQAEVGLRLLSSQSLGEANPEGRIKQSMTRSKRAMLSFFSDIFNELKEHVEELDGYRHLFKGIDEEDEDKKLDREDKMVKTTHFIDEIRARRDEPTLAESMRKLYKLTDEQYEKIKFAGAVPLDPTWNQAVGMGLMQTLTGQGDQAPRQGPPMQNQDSNQNELEFVDDDLLLPTSQQ